MGCADVENEEKKVEEKEEKTSEAAGGVAGCCVGYLWVWERRGKEKGMGWMEEERRRT